MKLKLSVPIFDAVNVELFIFVFTFLKIDHTLYSLKTDNLVNI